VAVLYFGLGLCGLSPFFALALAVVHTVRSYRAARIDLPRGAVLAALLGPLLVPPLAGATIYGYQQRQQASLHHAMTMIGDLPELSNARIRAVATLAGEQDRLVELYATTSDHRIRQTIADVYHRLTDNVLDAAHVRRVGLEDQRVLLRPFAHLEGRSPFTGNGSSWWRWRLL
jgi:hypothetical protein